MSLKIYNDDTIRTSDTSNVSQDEIVSNVEITKIEIPQQLPFNTDWGIYENLGEGAYGEVRMCINRKTGMMAAAKIINKDSSSQKSVVKEVFFHKMLKHKHIVKFYMYSTCNYFHYILMEYVSGGLLYDLIEPNIGMNENTARIYFSQLMDALNYMNESGLTHRDIKPENMMIDEQNNLKLCDFGFTSMYIYNGIERKLEFYCGTELYIAPELLARTPYLAKPADIWSCGIVLIVMLVGAFPWERANIGCPIFIDWYQNKNLSKSLPFNRMSDMAYDLAKNILRYIPKKRFTIIDIMNHDWMINKPVKTIPSSRMACSQPQINLNISHLAQSQQKLFKLQKSTTNNKMCFSQPRYIDEQILPSQIIQHVQDDNIWQRMVNRMTRFTSCRSMESTLFFLKNHLKDLKFNFKCFDNCITVYMLDSYRKDLVFKINAISFKCDVLLDWRLSKGNGLEFKKIFVKLVNSLEIPLSKIS
ncbi:hypothetical protein A3Q56_02670 [Intoshia linei]|uniref:non-specific serine/threonine protein kinase n=1 Tax=Intoshia linei TaxID=1819745 RepID=A0A177B857_9BILA|nr:hypothetical protein A3Q56_02670 [Intoshia linei]